MVLQIKVKYMKLPIWLLFGNFHVFSFAKITCTEWEQQTTEQQQTPITTPEVTRFQDLNAMHKTY
jgi:hypothetical protein